MFNQTACTIEPTWTNAMALNDMLARVEEYHLEKGLRLSLDC
jgi:hypothetical protein